MLSATLERLSRNLDLHPFMPPGEITHPNVKMREWFISRWDWLNEPRNPLLALIPRMCLSES